MQLCDVFLGLGEQNFQSLLRTVSMGRLRTFQLFDRLKARAHLSKLNSETLRRAAPRLWSRLSEKEDEFASDLAQAVLVSHLDMIRAVLDFLSVPHQDGFFAKDADLSACLTAGWQQRVLERFQGQYPQPVLLFYVNHLAWEVGKADAVYTPAL
ncbi:MAG: hypothetical protein HY235_16315 [Acidobacteria bacterium]|nr:hypothetical protein [Acidobacteriota bacterium]